MASVTSLPAKSALSRSRGVCTEKTRLIDRYTAALNDHLRVVQYFQSRVGILSKYSYHRIRGRCERALMYCEQSRHALERHCAEHGC